MRRSMVVLGLVCGMEVLAMQSPGRQVIGGRGAEGPPFSDAIVAGGFVYTAGALGTNAQGQLAKGDVKAQTRQTLENLAAVLEKAGSNLAHAVSASVYLKNASDFGAMNEVYRTFWTADPPTRTTVVADLALPDALVEISIVAVPVGTTRQVIHPEGWATSPNPYSYAIKANDTLFLAGLVARNLQDNSVVAGDMETQTNAVLENAGELLRAAGMSYADVVSSRVFITELSGFDAMNKVYRTFFAKEPPVRATVRTELMGTDYAVEITLIAATGQAREIFTTPNADSTPGRPNPNFSSAVKVGNRLYVAGMLGATAATKGDAAAQTREALARIGRTLTAAGFGFGDVVDAVVYLKSMSDYQAMNGVYREVLGGPFPARATVRSDLVNPDGLVEIMFTAVKD